MAKLLPLPKARFLDANGAPLAGGKVHTYAAGSNTPQATFTDSGGLTSNANPVILDANGEASIWIGASAYKITLTDADDVAQWTVDNVTDYSGAGADGATIRNGSGAPSDGLGANGDYYIDTDTQDLYFKDSGSYSVIMSLGGTDGADGSDGADGADGSTILSGSGAPGSGVGVDNDFYYDPTAKIMYGPKASGSWPAGVALVGDTGAAGADGATWRTGSGAPSDALGVDGDLYLDTDTSDVYLRDAGTYSVAANIKGDAGAAGANGANGTNGTDGDDGAPGANGAAYQEALTGVFSAGNTVFTTTNAPTAPAEVIFWLAGIPQIQDIDYSVSGSSITFTGIDVSGSPGYAFYRY